MFRHDGSRRRRAAALTWTELRRLVTGCGVDLAGRRDHVLLLSFAGVPCRSALVRIDRKHLRLPEAGRRPLRPASAAHDTDRGSKRGITRGKRADAGPVRSIEAWRTAATSRWETITATATPCAAMSAAPSCSARASKLLDL